eukprot:g6665.t1
MSIETHVLDDQDVLGKWACNKELEVSALVVSERLYDAIENGRLPERANALAALPQIALPGDGPDQLFRCQHQEISSIQTVHLQQCEARETDCHGMAWPFLELWPCAIGVDSLDVKRSWQHRDPL